MGTAFQPGSPLGSDSTPLVRAPSMMSFSRHQIRMADTRPPSWPTSYTKSSLARVSRMSE